MSGGARRLLPFLRTAWPWLLLVALAAIGWHEFQQVDLVEVRRIVGATDPPLILARLAVTAVNLAVAGFYDVAALAFAIGVAIVAVWHSGLIPGSRPADPERRLSAFVLVGIALVDWLLAWVVFHLAVDGTHGDVIAGPSLRVFFFGQLVGVLSFVPGGHHFGAAFEKVAERIEAFIRRTGTTAMLPGSH